MLSFSFHCLLVSHNSIRRTSGYRIGFSDLFQSICAFFDHQDILICSYILGFLGNNVQWQRAPAQRKGSKNLQFLLFQVLKRQEDAESQRQWAVPTLPVSSQVGLQCACLQIQELQRNLSPALPAHLFPAHHMLCCNGWGRLWHWSPNGLRNFGSNLQDIKHFKALNTVGYIRMFCQIPVISSAHLYCEKYQCCLDQNH